MKQDPERPSSREVVSIQVNGEARLVPVGSSVADLLHQLDLHPGMVVVELNREILPREGLADAAIGEGDRIELVHFVGGG